MSLQIAQSTAFLCVFKAYLASDHVTEATGKTIAVTISKNGGAFGNPNAGATNATEITSGWYKVSLDTTDTATLGPIAIRGAVATIDDVGVLVQVVKATNGGLTALPDTACTTNASLLTSGTGTAQVTAASGQVTVATNNDKTGYALTSGERNSVADALLDRDMSTGADSGSTTVRTMRQAMRFLRNKWSISGTTLTVTKEDDATASWTSTVTTSASADPITANDPAGP